MTLPSTFDEPSEETLRAERAQPVVLVIRDPDASDEILLLGLPDDVTVEYLDLGSSFDIGHFDYWGRLDASEWVVGQVIALQQYPPEHRARQRMNEVVVAVCEAFGLNADGSLAE